MGKVFGESKNKKVKKNFEKFSPFITYYFELSSIRKCSGVEIKYERVRRESNE
jgi:hypothetical protein